MALCLMTASLLTPWEAKRSEIVDPRLCEWQRSLKRYYDWRSSENSSVQHAKRKTISSSTTQFVCGVEELLLPHSIEDPSLVKQVACFEAGRDCSSSSSKNESWKGSQIPYPCGFVRLGGQDVSIQTDHQGLELVSLLISCAESISSENHAATAYYLDRLGQQASPAGTPIQRVIAYFSEAFALRAVKLWPHIFSIAPPRELSTHTESDDDDAVAWQLLNHVSPIPKFLHFSLNERLLKSFEGKDRLHIIDFDIKQGLQWPSLLQSLASRDNPPTHVRITGIGQSKHDLQDTGATLAGLAEALNLPFEFHAVVDSLEDVRLWMLHVKEEEFVAVNCILQLHKVLYDESLKALMDLLGLIRATNPLILLLAEEEAKHSESRWEDRVANSLKYYSSIFDSLHSSLPGDSPARIKVEEMFARKIRNIVCCEGSERVERHEMFDKWTELMEVGGFRSVAIGEREAMQSQMLLRMYPSNENYSVLMKEQGQGLTLKWLDQTLYAVSAWAPISIAGSSSTTQPG